MKVVNAEEMGLIDNLTIRKYGIPSLQLMERAGRAVALRVREDFGKGNIVILVGPGNNGGDGLVAARYLKRYKFKVKVYLLFEEKNMSEDARVQLERIKKSRIPYVFSREIHNEELKDAIIIDALFGTGLKREISGRIAELIETINNSGNPVVAVDIPSGISSDDGSIMGKAIKADLTVTFGLPKRGHLLYPGSEYTGRLYVEDIGFPEELIKSKDLRVELLEKEFVKNLIPQRKRYSHKGTYGHLLIIAGSRGKTGACLLAARAALRTGAGLVTVGVPESLLQVFESRVTDEMCLGLPDRGDGLLKKDAIDLILEFIKKPGRVIAIGPGIGVSEDTKVIIKELIEQTEVPMVIDADGINCLQGMAEILKNKKGDIVLTPHPGEMARLTGLQIEEIERRRIDLPQELSLKYGATIVLKGVPTVIGHNGNSYVNPTGNPGMAKAGSGDVLTGIIGGLMAQGLTGLDSAILGVYLHGLAGDIGASHKGGHSLLASDIIEYIPDAFKELKG
jgi:hydroxyethylthiazole kinase-like uncharacterized protein yjeF